MTDYRPKCLCYATAAAAAARPTAQYSGVFNLKQWPAIVQVRMLALRSLPDYHNLMPSYSPSPRDSRIREIRYEPFHGERHV